MRRRLASIAEEARAISRAAPEVTVHRLRRMIESLQAFDLESHRPKGVVLMQAMRGRSPDADRLLAELEQEREHDDALLVQALRLLDAFADGDESAGAGCAAVLARHREKMLRHLDEEDTVLCLHSERLLTQEEWSRVVSAISTALHVAGAEPGEPDRPGKPGSLPRP